MEYIADVHGVKAIGAIGSSTLLDISAAGPRRRVGCCPRIAGPRFISVSHDEGLETEDMMMSDLFFV